MQDTGDTFSVRAYPRQSLSICSEASEVWLWSCRVQVSIRRAVYLVYLSPRIPSAARCEFQLELEIRLFIAIVIKAVEKARGLLVSIRLAIECVTF